jgi:hypothetical protein
MGTGSFPGVKCGRGVLLTTQPLLVPRSWKSRAIPLPALWASNGITLPLHYGYHVMNYIFILIYCGPGSSVSIMTDYGLVVPGSNPGGDEIFRLSKPVLGPTQPPVKWVLVLSRWVKCGRGVLLTTHPLLVPRSWKSRAIYSTHPLGHTGPVTGSLYLYLCAITT